MTVPVGPNFATYIGDGITTVFAYNFRIPTLENVEISTVRLSDGLQTILTPADYTITGVDINNYAGGTVTYPLAGSPLTSTHRIYIRRVAPLTQPTDLRNQGGYFPESVEFTFDWLEFQIQMMLELLDRAVLTPPGMEGLTIIPGPSDFIPQYDVNGDLTKSLDPALFTSGTAPVFGVVSFGPWDADGVQTQWTLPLAPVLSGNLVVFVSGVFQDYSARSVSGTTLTFTSPPPADTTVSGYIVAVSSAVQVPTPGSVGAAELDAGDIGPMRTVLDVYSKAEVDTKIAGVKGADLASAATVNLGAATGDFVDITGIVTITSFGTAAAGVERTVRFTGALTLTHNATSLQLACALNITTFNGLVMRFRSLGSGNWKEVSQTPARGSNANGEYVRFADGTQKCWLNLVTGSVAIDVASAMGGFQTAAANWTFPLAFLAGTLPAVSMTPTGDTAAIASAGTLANTLVSYRLRAITTQAAAVRNLSLTAIGRWF